MAKTPKNNVVILLGGNTQIGRELKYRKMVGYYPAHIHTNKMELD